MTTKHFSITLSIVAVMALSTGCNNIIDNKGNNNNNNNETATVDTNLTALTKYADKALEMYTAAHASSVTLQSKITAFTTNPTETTLNEAKEAWLAARETYSPTEIFRLSNGPIDAKEGYAASWNAPEGQLNAWPLDENMIDYTIDENGNRTSGNIIDTTGSFTPTGTGGTAVNVATLNKEAIASLNENGGDANVATGYHAIEFLLWGQDQDYFSLVRDNVTHGAMVAGQRPLSDYTTDSRASRRKAYLNAAAELIVEDLNKMIAAWNKTDDNYRKALLGTHPVATNNIGRATAFKQIFGGMGVFVKSELANERMAVAVLTPSEEDEHSCFSDNTHRDIVLNYEGFKTIMNIAFKPYLSTAEQNTINTMFTSVDTRVALIDTTAKNTKHFDYQIQENDATRQNVISAKNELRDLGDEMIDVAAAFGITLTSGDVTDSQETNI